ncbi:recombinase family protein [Paeniglutamicibacter cryotolerans]|uniref:DNA invertase Pin-like site-specific DNA recombinase n=1 Tax=Paeniglutamicibacter cryotolerans TaxID=670079 RepID=A0A839QYE9_9MICC|nr:recombinase family protein [Paeniglutamicibacter cryotolerans]MBB2996981.1 DNA invertase Pin-like site-specific DNA recombinase [Paeniglutamicibacter cryotolerans]
MTECREGDTFEVTKFDRLERYLREAHSATDGLASRGVNRIIDGSVYDPNDSMEKLLLTVLSMIAEFGDDPIQTRPHEGMKAGKANCRLPGRSPTYPKSRKLTS